MKLRKVPLSIIISAMLISIPTGAFAWLQLSTYEACNVINSLISGLLKMIAFIISNFVLGIYSEPFFTMIEQGLRMLG